MLIRHLRTLALPALVALGTAIASQPAHATFTFTFTQSGSNVVETGSGTLNTGGLPSPLFGGGSPAIDPSSFFIEGGNISGAQANIYQTSFSVSSGPLGTGVESIPDAGIGDLVGFSSGSIIVPKSYVSGTALSDTDTFTGGTFSSLGLTVGSYTYTFGSGANADSIIVNVGSQTQSTPVPEPAAMGVFASALGLFGLLRLRGRRV